MKKVVRKSSSLKEVTVYIDGGFEYLYTLDGSDVIDEENNEIHVMDGRSRVAVKRVGTAFSGDSSHAVRYNLEDHLGNAAFTVDSSGSLIHREEYFPFGETSFGSYSKKRYRFCGKERDEESGLYYYGARYYAPWCCRFVSVDPLAEKYVFFTPYQYAGNKPIISVDIDGLEGDKETSLQNSDPKYEWGSGAQPDQDIAPVGSHIYSVGVTGLHGETRPITVTVVSMPVVGLGRADIAAATSPSGQYTMGAATVTRSSGSQTSLQFQTERPTGSVKATMTYLGERALWGPLWYLKEGLVAAKTSWEWGRVGPLTDWAADSPMGGQFGFFYHGISAGGDASNGNWNPLQGFAVNQAIGAGITLGTVGIGAGARRFVSSGSEFSNVFQDAGKVLGPGVQPSNGGFARIVHLTGASDFGHFAIFVDAGAASFGTHQVTSGALSATTINEYRYSTLGTKRIIGEIGMSVPNAMNGQAYQLSMIGKPLGPYNRLSNSCVTHVFEVLKASGAEVPSGAIGQIKYLKNIGFNF